MQVPQKVGGGQRQGWVESVQNKKGGPLVCGRGGCRGGWGLGPKVKPPSEEALNRREKTGLGVSPLSHQEGCCCRAVAQGRRDGQSAR